MLLTPACFNMTWTCRANRTLRWHLGIITGCFSSPGNPECCKRPCNPRRPSSPRNGLNWKILDFFNTLWPWPRAHNSSLYSVTWTQPWHYTTQKKVRSPWTRSTEGHWAFLINLKTQPTTRMDLVRETQRSISNTDSQTEEVTRSAGPVITFLCFSSITISTGSEALPYRHTSDSSQMSSPLRNKGLWSHWSDWTSSDAERPRVKWAAGLSLPATWCHWEGAARDWIYVIWLATKGFHRWGSLLIHANATVESVQQWHRVSPGNFKASHTWTTRHELNSAPNNSNRGKDTFFNGATLARENTKEADQEPSWPRILTYTHAP